MWFESWFVSCGFLLALLSPIVYISLSFCYTALRLYVPAWMNWGSTPLQSISFCFIMMSSSIVFVFCSLQDLLCVWCCHAEAQECVWQVRGVSLVYFHLPCFTQWVVVVVLAEMWLNPIDYGTEPYGGGGDGEPERNAILADAPSPLEWWLQKCRQWYESFTAPSPLEWWLHKCRQWHESFCCFMNSRWHSHLKIIIVGS